MSRLMALRGAFEYSPCESSVPVHLPRCNVLKPSYPTLPSLQYIKNNMLDENNNNYDTCILR